MTTAHDTIVELTQTDLRRLVGDLQSLNHDAYSLILDGKPHAPQYADSTPEALGYQDPPPVSDDLGFNDVVDRVGMLRGNLRVAAHVQARVIDESKATRLREVGLVSDVEAFRRVIGTGPPRG